MTAWTHADAWYRRDVGNGSWLTVSRTPGGSWSWRLSRYTAAGPVKLSLVFASAEQAMADADMTVGYLWPRLVAAA